MKVDPLMVPVTWQIAEMPIFRGSGLRFLSPGPHSGPALDYDDFVPRVFNLVTTVELLLTSVRAAQSQPDPLYGKLIVPMRIVCSKPLVSFPQ
jgi:hypothetical protein